jgi:hypothetical protein
MKDLPIEMGTKNIPSSIYNLQTQNFKMQTSLHNPIIASKPPHL